MKPAPFDYLRAASAGEAVEALADAGEAARLLAGGQSLAPMLNMRLVQPVLLIDIARVAELKPIAAADGVIEVGAAATQAELLEWPALARLSPLLAAALPWVGHVQTRNRGTVCGSIAHADPSAELPLVLATLGGEVLLRSVRGARRLPAADFFAGTLATACAPDEMVERVRFPAAPPGSGHAFREVAIRHGDFALAAFAAVAGPDCLRLGVGGVADRPVVRDWPPLAGDALQDALHAFAAEIDARSDPQADAAYRRRLVRRIGLRTLEEAIACRG